MNGMNPLPTRQCDICRQPIVSGQTYHVFGNGQAHRACILDEMKRKRLENEAVLKEIRAKKGGK